MYKSKLQEVCQQRRWAVPKYDTEKIGLDHDPRFRGSVSVNGLSFAGLTVSGCRSAKEAQNEAARVAYLHLTSTAPPGVASPAYPSPSSSSAAASTASSPLAAVPCPGKAKVTVDGQTFESTQSFNLLEEFESSAARVDLMSLSEDGGHEDPSCTYKNRLLELVKKDRLSAPVYETSMDGPSHIPVFTSTVRIEGEKFIGTPAKSKKQAEQNAAKVAWCSLKERKSSRCENLLPNLEVGQSINMVSSGVRSAASNVFLPPELSPPETSSVSASCTLCEGMGSSCKSKLQIYTQKRNLNLPSYECVREGSLHALQYKAKVTVDGQTFVSPQSFNLLKEAENAAARIALMSLSVDGGHEDSFCTYKNLLLELAQKEGISTPVYETSTSGPSHIPVFSSTVLIEGEKFNGIAAKAKKQAEQNAAKVAWFALKERNSSRRANLLPNFEVCHSTEVASSNARSVAIGTLPQAELSPQETASGSTSCIQPEDCRDALSEDCTHVEASSIIHPMASHCPQQETAKSAVVDSGSRSNNTSDAFAAKAKVSLGDGLPSRSMKLDSDANKDVLEKTSSLPHCRVQVYPGTANFVPPDGGTLLPCSDDKWVAVSFDSGEN